MHSGYQSYGIKETAEMLSSVIIFILRLMGFVTFSKILLLNGTTNSKAESRHQITPFPFHFGRTRMAQGQARHRGVLVPFLWKNNSVT